MVYQDKDSEIVLLQERLSTREQDIAVKDNDLRDVINRHEHEVKQLASKDVNMQDAVIQSMEQKVKDVNDVLDSKLKVIQMLQADLVLKDKVVSEKTTDMKMMQEKLSVTSEQVRILQDTLTSVEAQWAKEKTTFEQLTRDTSVPLGGAAATSESSAYVEQLTASVKQYETAYQQLSEQYTALHHEYTRVMTSTQQTQSPDAQALQAELKQKTEQVEVLQKQLENSEAAGVDVASGSGGGGSKPDAKFLKYKAQTTAKIKNLEKQIEQLKKVRLF